MRARFLVLLASLAGCSRSEVTIGGDRVRGDAVWLTIFAGEAIHHAFVFSTADALCRELEDAYDAGREADARLDAARASAADDVEVCHAARDWLEAKADADERLVADGTLEVEVRTADRDASDTDPPAPGTYGVADPDRFFGATVVEHERNPWRTRADALDCDDPAWRDADVLLASELATSALGLRTGRLELGEHGRHAYDLVVEGDLGGRDGAAGALALDGTFRSCWVHAEPAHALWPEEEVASGTP
jgi:hypothetical protein